MWTDPVTDRDAADIVAKNSKAFFNVADWVRINGNAVYVRTLLLALRGVSITFNTLVTPTTATLPAVDDINDFITNLEMLRTNAALPSTSGIVELKSDYTAFASSVAPDYEDVNDWEQNLDLLKTLLISVSTFMVYCGISTTGQLHFWQSRFRTQFIQDSTAPVQRPRVGVAVCGRDLDRQNAFRRYD